MNDVMKFIYRITSGGANHGVIESFSGRNSYWFASILFRRFIRNNATIMYDPKNNCFGTRIGGKVYDVTGDVTDEDMAMHREFYKLGCEYLSKLKEDR